MTIRIEGAKELQKALKALPGRVATKVVRGATLAGAGVIRKEAQNRVPVDSGKLKKGIVARKTDQSKYHFTYSVGPRSNVFYGQFLEFGTEKIAARPFLRPAFDTKKGAAVKKIQERLRAGIDREVKKLRNK